MSTLVGGTTRQLPSDVSQARTFPDGFTRSSWRPSSVVYELGDAHGQRGRQVAQEERTLDVLVGPTACRGAERPMGSPS